MSQENVELVRRYIGSLVALMDQAEDSMGRRAAGIELPGFSSHVDKYWHPEVVFDVSGRPDGGVYHGREGVTKATRDWLEAWEDFDIEFKEVLPVGDQLVLVHVAYRGTAKSGIEIELPDLYLALTVSDGQFIHYEEHYTQATALEAAGLSE